MSKQFKPLVTRIKLNPEQAVLACSCYHGGLKYINDGGPFIYGGTGGNGLCYASGKNKSTLSPTTGPGASYSVQSSAASSSIDMRTRMLLYFSQNNRQLTSGSQLKKIIAKQFFRLLSFIQKSKCPKCSFRLSF